MRAVSAGHITNCRAPDDPAFGASTYAHDAVAPPVAADAPMTDFNIAADVQFPTDVVAEFDGGTPNVATRRCTGAGGPWHRPFPILPFRRRPHRRRTRLAADRRLLIGGGVRTRWPEEVG
jgi:hypothetical protein